MTGSTRSSGGLDDRRKRLLFRCWHRGTREMDLILGRFADAEIAGLTDHELAELDQLFELGQFMVGEPGDLGVGKAAENEIHLAGAAMPAAKQQPLAAVIEAAARSCRSRHFPDPMQTQKARTCRAG